MGALPPNPRDLSLWFSKGGKQNEGETFLTPTPPLFRNLTGAQVASQHCLILLPGKSLVS
jgi:hypothetical protein